MNAANVLGQADFTHAVAATTQSNFITPAGVLYEPTTHNLYVADVNNNRYLIFDAATIADGESAISGLGQYDDNAGNPGFVFTKGGASNSPSQYGFSTPRGTAVDPTHHRLFVADGGNNRVLVYNLTSGNVLSDRLPDYVLGQANFHSNTAATTATGLSAPFAVTYDATRNRIFVSDNGNNRIVVFSGATLSSGMNAAYVLGQANFTSAAAATTQAGFNAPQGISYDGVTDRLFVADTGNHRVEVFDGASLASSMNASTVLGQAGFTGASTATTQTGMNGPVGVSYDTAGSRLFVSDNGNNRVLVFTGATLLTNGMSASYVLGQADFTHAVATTTQTGLRGPSGVQFDSSRDRLFVSDNGNNRLVVFDAGSIVNGLAGSSVLGQTNFTASGATVTQTGLSGPRDVAYDATANQLYVADAGNNRVLDFSDAVASSSSSETVSTSPANAPIQSGGHRGSAIVPPRSPFFSHSSSSATYAASSSSAGNSFPSNPSDSTSFSDVPLSSWFFSYVTSLASNGIVSGYRDAHGIPTGQFGPGNPVTEAEILKMALLASGKTIAEGSPQNASAQNDWSAPYVREAEILRLSVYTSSLDVHQAATRGQVVKTVLEAFGVILATGDNPFHDLPATSSFASAIETAAKLGIISGDTDAQGHPVGTVRPEEPINRAEAAKVVALMREKIH
jgi:DNA-binding beta-propeller fold protein YncE